jgi:aminoglycoside/choline kinase family phosphotransferase
LHPNRACSAIATITVEPHAEGGTLYIIDFQDARMGPDTYDLASLLRDSYVDFTEDEVEELIAFFLALKGERETSIEFRRRFDLMALQRNLKGARHLWLPDDLARESVYIQYMPRTLNYARANLERYAALRRLRDLLAEHLEELR